MAFFDLSFLFSFFLSISASLFQIITFLYLFTGAIAGFSFAPWVPTKKRDLERIFALANLKEGEKVYELGFGDGRFIFQAVEKYNVKGIGIEINPIMYFIGYIKRCFFKKKNNLVLKWGDFFSHDLSDADVVYFWGLPDTIENKLRQKLEKELKKGTRVISYVFEIKGWQPERIDKKPKEVPIFLYIKK